MGSVARAFNPGDVVKVERAHVTGSSMYGMIVRFADRPSDDPVHRNKWLVRLEGMVIAFEEDRLTLVSSAKT